MYPNIVHCLTGIFKNGGVESMEKFRTFDPCTLLSPVPAVMVSCRGTVWIWLKYWLMGVSSSMRIRISQPILLGWR